MYTRFAYLLLGALCALLAMEFVLQFLPVPRGFDLINGYGTVTTQGYRPGSDVVYSRDWDFLYARRGAINAYGYHGFCTTQVLANQRRLWIVGDSYAEAMMLEPAKTLGAQLQNRIPDLAVCTQGVSGAPGSEYLAILDALPVRQPRDIWVVLLNTADIPESRSGRDGLHYFSDRPGEELTGKIRTEPNWLGLARRSALFRYVNYSLDGKGIAQRLGCELHLSKCAFAKNGSQTSEAENGSFVSDARRLLGALSARARARDADLVVVLNAFEHRSQIKDEMDARQRVVLARELSSASIRFVDVKETYATAAECRLSACYLFRDGHWSEAGHAAIARAVEDALHR